MYSPSRFSIAATLLTAAFLLLPATAHAASQTASQAVFRNNSGADLPRMHRGCQ
jgi:hypothetical protein